MLVDVEVDVGVLVGVRVGVRVGVFVGVFVGVRVGVGVLVGVFVGVLVGVLVGVGEGATHTPWEQTFGSGQQAPLAQTDASGGRPPARVLVGQQPLSGVQVPLQQALSQHSVCEVERGYGSAGLPVQQAGPHLLGALAGQVQTPPTLVCWPGHVTGVVDGVGRVAASESPSTAVAPIRAAPPRPSSPLSTVRRLAPDAMDLTSESNRRSSMNHPHR